MRPRLILPFIPPLLAAAVAGGCGGSRAGEDTGIETFQTVPAQSPVTGLVSEDGEAQTLSGGGTRFLFQSSESSLGITVPAGTTLPANLTFGSPNGVQGGATMFTTAAAPVGWIASSGTVRISRPGPDFILEIDAEFVPSPDVNPGISAGFSPGFRVIGIARAN